MHATSDPALETLDALLSAHGAAVGSFAYLVLQHQADAERILATALAEAVRRGHLQDDGEAERRWLLAAAARAILRGSSQSGEVEPLLPDPRDPSDRLSILGALAELDPRSRMAVVLLYVLDLSPDAIAEVLNDVVVALRSDLNEARNRLQSRDGDLETSDGGEAADGEPFDDRLRTVLTAEAGRFQPIVDPRALLPVGEQAAALRRAPRRWWPFALLAAVAAALVTFFWFVPDSGSTAGRLQADSSASPSPTRTTAAPITLADCDIAPADAPLAFAGWTTLAALGVHGGDVGPGQPIYALVTRGMAEWVGWQKDHSGPMYPAPIGRMGCILDPSIPKTSLVGVDQDWEPGLMADGCPPSHIDEFGGYRETGGPHGWLLLPNAASTSVDEGFSNVMLWRLSPPAEPGQSITAWAQPLADASPVVAAIDSSTSRLAPPDSSGGSSRYYFVSVRFATTGCWVINIEINGAVVGSAIVPIGGLSLRATQEPVITAP